MYIYIYTCPNTCELHQQYTPSPVDSIDGIPHGLVPLNHSVGLRSSRPWH